MNIVVAISGASGSPYARRLLSQLRADPRVFSLSLVLSRTAARVYAHECDEDVHAFAGEHGIPVFEGRDYDAPFASGSAAPDAMVVIPASMSCLARIAHGISDDILTRAADVVLKERRKLIVVPRETPLSAIHLENMLTLTRAGALLLPAAPGFYHHPRSVQDLVDTVVARVRAHLGVPDRWARRWDGADACRWDGADARPDRLEEPPPLRPVAGHEEDV